MPTRGVKWDKVQPLHRFFLPPANCALERKLVYDCLEQTNSRWITIHLEDFEAVYEDIIAESTECIASPSAIYDYITRRRYVPTDHIFPSEADCASQYLRQVIQVYGLPNLEAVPERETVYVNLPILPAYSDGKSHSQQPLAIVDIISAYWSLLRCVPLDTTYLEGTVTPGRIHFLEQNQMDQCKLVRNSLYGLTRTPTSTKHYRFGHEVQTEWQKPQPFWNPHLSHIIVNTMQAIAIDCLEKFGIYQWITDAAIVPAKRASSLMQYLSETWHLETRLVTEGKGVIKGYGAYDIGSQRIEGQATGPISTLDPTTEPDFWKLCRQFFYPAIPKNLPNLPPGRHGEIAEHDYSEPIEVRL
jgi:hypothetical protein